MAYNKLTGMLTWRVDRSRRAKAGDEAGAAVKSGTVLVGIQGKSYPAARLIWLYVKGEWPRGRLRLLDNDPNNLRWNNITEEVRNLSNRPVNIYQRKHRYLTKEAQRRLSADPSLSKRYYDSPDQGHQIMQRLRDEILADLNRNSLDPESRPASLRRRRVPSKESPTE
jgi:hypothetical protein